jgi:hypothetical protein
VQADTKNATETNATHMTYVPHADNVFQDGHIAVFSGYFLPVALVIFDVFTSEEPPPSRFIPASVTQEMRRASARCLSMCSCMLAFNALT